MRRRIFLTILGVAVITVVRFGVPLPIAVERRNASDATLELQRIAGATASQVPDGFATSKGAPLDVATRCVATWYVVMFRDVAGKRKSTGLRRSNDPPVLILTSLAGGPKHGHALAKDIEAVAGVRLGPGALYGAITRLEERGLIQPIESDDRRRPYRITPAGRAALGDAIIEMRRISDIGAARLGLKSAGAG
jgi:DNA-binding PadR family transcriptional regulator